ncbi:MAG: alpha/beta fold hydrolase [Pseudomonadota bacterium]
MDQRPDIDVVVNTLERSARSALQFYEARGQGRRQPRPIVFVHGAFSGGWIWGRYFQPFFAKHGFDSYAIDLRGRRAISPFIPTPHGLSDYVADVQDLIAHVGQPPILVGHSLGGMVAQKASATERPYALALLASVPPEGMSFASWQMAVSNPLLFWNTASFAMSPAMRSISVAREALFSADAPDAIARDVLRRSSPEAPRALMEAQLPLACAPGYLSDIPVTVIGACDDQLIPVSAVERTAQFHGVEPILFEDTAHALMVDTRWNVIAQHLLDWIQQDVL